jgi:asparaginyl-tRNA synthetase
MKKEHIKDLIKLNETFSDAARAHYVSIGLTNVEVPAIVGITGACENVDTLFRIGNRLGVPLFFNQTGQLSLEQALQHFPGVYTVIHSGRDEEEEDERHLRQFRLTEEEFDWSFVGPEGIYDEEKMYEALLVHIEAATKSVAKAVAGRHADILREFGRDANGLLESLTRPYLRITYEEAVALLKKNGYPRLAWGDDLKAEHEAKIVALLNGNDFARPVFIMRYPKEIKFFNMKVSAKDERAVLSADLIFPYAGEGAGSAVREHDGEKLTERLLGSTMFRLHEKRGGTLDDFKWYLDLVRSGETRPHAGYGIGNERLIQYLLGRKDIRECSLFHLMAEETRDWKMPVLVNAKTTA